MNTENCHIEVISCLREGGWYEGRVIDLSSVEIEMERLGFQMFESARVFLNEFGGLIIPMATGRKTELDTVRTDTFRFSSYGTDPDIYGGWIGDTLCPVGEFMEDGYGIYVSIKGTFYIVNNSAILIAGTSPSKAIENLVSNKNFQEVPD